MSISDDDVADAAYEQGVSDTWFAVRKEFETLYELKAISPEKFDKAFSEFVWNYLGRIV